MGKTQTEILPPRPRFEIFSWLFGLSALVLQARNRRRRHVNITATNTSHRTKTHIDLP